jgi:hypothetical protein
MAEPIKYQKHAGTLEMENRLREPLYVSDLFEREIDDIYSEQLALLSSLDSRFNLANARKFQNHVHFQGASQTPVQRWFPYREGYSIALVEAFLQQLAIRGNVFDPFCGSGTTLLAARFNDLAAFGIDINPISCLVSTVENSLYIPDDITYSAGIVNELDSLQRPTKTYFTNFELADKVFNDEVLQALLLLKEYINAITETKIKNLFFVAWLGIIEQVSNFKKEGNGIKYKNRKRTARGYIDIDKAKWEEYHFPQDKFAFVVAKYKKHLEKILFDLKSNYGATNKIPKVFLGDCLKFAEYFDAEIQFTFFSPPYCNCFDYFEIHKVELWLGDFITSRDVLKKLRNTGLRSNTNAIANKPIDYYNPALEKIIKLFDPEKLWNAKIPSVVRGYFDDMHKLLQQLHSRTVKGGYVGIVVGNSAYAGIIVPTDVLISDIARQLGFEVEKIFITRHLTTSSQQKLQLKSLSHYLRESIILLRK